MKNIYLWAAARKLSEVCALTICCCHSKNNAALPSPLSASSSAWRSLPSDCGHGVKRWVLFIGESRGCMKELCEFFHFCTSADNQQVICIGFGIYTQVSAWNAKVALLNHKGMSCFPMERPHEQWSWMDLMHFTDSFILLSVLCSDAEYSVSRPSLKNLRGWFVLDSSFVLQTGLQLMTIHFIFFFTMF